MLEKIKASAWYIQLIGLVVIAVVLYASVWYFFTSVTRAETQGIEDQVAQKTAQNEAARIATQRIDEFRSLYASKSQEYDELKVLLPEQREITNVLHRLKTFSRIILRRNRSKSKWTVISPICGHSSAKWRIFNALFRFPISNC